MAGSPRAGTARGRTTTAAPGHLRGRLFRRPSPRGRAAEAEPPREPGRSRLTPSSAPDPGGAALLARRLSGSRLRASGSADVDSPAAAEVAAALPWRSIGAPSRPAPIRSSRRCRPSQAPSAALPPPRSPPSAGARGCRLFRCANVQRTNPSWLGAGAKAVVQSTPRLEPKGPRRHPMTGIQDG